MPNFGETTGESDTDRVVRFLAQPVAHTPQPDAVEVIETHISYVFLAGQQAYKLVKPVRYEFVDFSTRAARRSDCQREVALNRRFAPDVYLGVTPITTDSEGRLHIGGDGPAVEWLVEMRRLPADRMLDGLIAAGAVRQDDVRRLADRLCDFYLQAPPLDVEAEKFRREIQRHVMANREELLSPKHGLPEETIRRTHTAQLTFLKTQASQIDERVRLGRVIDGHGDLRPEHVCLEEPPVVFDCVEFSDEFRRLDVLDELAFFAMECEFLGAPEIGRRVIDVYLQRSGDRPRPELPLFYQTYRACVRAKVEALRACQQTGSNRQASREQALTHVKLADAYSRRFAKPFAVIVRGAMGTGKSTLASALGQELGIARLSTDELRQARFGASEEPSAYNSGNYTPARRQEVYDTLIDGCDAALQEQLSVALDGAFLTAENIERVWERCRRRRRRLVGGHLPMPRRRSAAPHRPTRGAATRPLGSEAGASRKATRRATAGAKKRANDRRRYDHRVGGSVGQRLPRVGQSGDCGWRRRTVGRWWRLIGERRPRRPLLRGDGYNDFTYSIKSASSPSLSSPLPETSAGLWYLVSTSSRLLARPLCK